MVRKRRLAWLMFWAVVTYAATTLGTGLATYLTTFAVTPQQGSLISTGIGLAVMTVGVLIEYIKESGGHGTAAQRHGTAAHGQGGGNGRTTSWAMAILLTLVLCGGGGLAVTYAGHWVVQKLVTFIEEASTPPWEKKTQEPGVQRLAKPASKTSGPLTVTVTSVKVNSQVSIFEVTLKNTGGESLSVPIFESCQLSVAGAKTFKPDPGVGDWGLGTVPAGGQFRGVIVFDGVIDRQATKATLSFSTVHGSFNARKGISVDIPLTTW